MDHELGPSEFLNTIRRMIVTRRLARNGLYSPAYLRPDDLWMIVPEAFEKMARFMDLPYDTDSVDRMCASLRTCRWVVPGPAASLTQFVKTRPDSPPLQALRLRTPDVLGESEARDLGFHGFEIQVWSPPGEWEIPRSRSP
jgi:hypothetical protein